MCVCVYSKFIMCVYEINSSYWTYMRPEHTIHTRYIHTYIHKYIHTHMIHTYIHTYIQINKQSHLQEQNTTVGKYIYIHTYTHTYIHIYRSKIPLLANIYIHTYIHTYIHIYRSKIPLLANTKFYIHSVRVSLGRTVQELI